VGVVKNELNPRGQYVPAGTIALTPGQHTLTLTHAAHSLGGLLRAGDGGDTRLLGPTVLDPASDTRVVRQIPSSRWHDLCGKRLDWAEAIR